MHTKDEAEGGYERFWDVFGKVESIRLKSRVILLSNPICLFDHPGCESIAHMRIATQKGKQRASRRKRDFPDIKSEASSLCEPQAVADSVFRSSTAIGKSQPHLRTAQQPH
jgi:hypothetical protein